LVQTVPVDEGQLLDDRYRLSDRLGEGGVSETWQAHDELLDRAVVVKALAGKFAADAGLRGRVLREARAAAGPSHPNVAGVYDYGETPDHSPFVVMELLHGPTLAQRLADGPLHAGTATRICAEVAAGLAALHAADLVHGHVTPANVILTADAAKLVDFGVLGSSHEPDNANTPDSSGNLDPASDVHAFGVLLYSCLTFRLPSDESTPEVLADVEGVRADVRDLCVSCLAEDPADRPAAAEVASVLAAAAGIPLPNRPIRAIGIFAGTPADDVVNEVEEVRTRRQLRLALAMSTAAVVILASVLLTRDASTPQGLADPARPTMTGPAQPDRTSETPGAPGTDAGPSTDTGSDQSTDTTDSGPDHRVELVGNAGRPGNATDGGGQPNPVPGGTTAPPAGGTPSTTTPAPAPAAQATTPAMVTVRLSTLGGVVVAGCADGKVSVLDVLPAPGAKLVSVQSGTRDTARVEIDLLAVHLRLNVRCVAGLPVATPI
jgi:serine/threonine-protein kinase